MRWALAVAVVALVRTAAPGADDPSGAAFFRERVRPVLVENCWRCHGPERQRAGLRLDSREAVLRGGRTPVVVPGHPEDSRLVDAIGYDDADLQMPPDGMLEAAQRADLASWIRMGLPWAEAAAPPPAAPAASAAAPATPPIAAPAAAPALRWWTWMGHLHPLVVHFPLALILVAALAELRALWFRRTAPVIADRSRAMVRFSLLIAAPAGIVAVVLGWSAAAGHAQAGMEAALLLWHRWLGTATALLATIAVLLMPARLLPGARQSLARLALAIAALLVGVVGHLGGLLTHGVHWLALP